MRAVDIFALAMAVVIALLLLAVHRWSWLLWTSLLIAAFIALWTLLHMTLRRSSQVTARLATIAFLTVGLPSFGIWYWLNYPVSQKIMQTYFPSPYAPKSSPVPVARKFDATLGKAYYKCKFADVELTKEETEKYVADFKAYIEAWANAYGYKSPTVTTVLGGLRADVLPPHAWDDPSKRSFQIVRIGKELSGIYSADYMSPYSSALPMRLNSPLESSVHKVMEGLAKLEPGSCELQ
jgi:hypothetical protein